MDFVVTGLGLSALALLTGLALLCLVAPRWSRKSRAAHPEDGAYARALAGERSALGQGFLCVGAVLLLATLGGISAGLADKTGAYLVAAMATVALLGLFGWDLLYRRQHPLPRRRRVAPTRPIPADAEAAPAAVASTPPTGSPATTATTVRRRVLPARQRVAPAPPPPSAAESLTAAEREPDVVPSADEAHSVGTAAASLAIADDEAAAGPENPEPVATSGAHGDLPRCQIQRGGKNPLVRNRKPQRPPWLRWISLNPWQLRQPRPTEHPSLARCQHWAKRLTPVPVATTG
ncbi:MAG: hypothetical protein R2853_16555 [Thermomicrobiales bacterium]